MTEKPTETADSPWNHLGLLHVGDSCELGLFVGLLAVGPGSILTH